MASPLNDNSKSVAGLTPRSASPASGTRATQTRKRTAEASPVDASESSSRRKSGKISRACDYCKTKKLKCSGTLPCHVCIKKDLACQYDSQYRRGRPPTPPAASPEQGSARSDTHKPISARATLASRPGFQPSADTGQHASGTSTAGDYPGLESAEIEGQVVDSTSNLNFMHRAWRRLALQTRDALPDLSTAPEQQQPLISAGDRPFAPRRRHSSMLLDSKIATACFDFYFDNCVVTYRLLHQPSCQLWLQNMLASVENGVPPQQEVGHAKAALILSILAIASLRRHKLNHLPIADEDSTGLQLSELCFADATELLHAETGFPRLESIQARMLQVLYLLQTSRMNQAWYVFGSIVPMLSAIGLHRKVMKPGNGAIHRPNGDYIVSQCRKRTFWVVYTIDRYLAVVFGRPRLLHEDDINQELPDRVNDEDMTPAGLDSSEPTSDCHVDSLLFHARIARIIGNVSRDVYSLKQISDHDRLVAAQHYTNELHEWKRDLPPHLGTIRPSSLIPSFRRQCTALKLAYSHAIMHTNRPFLLEQTTSDQTAVDECVADCMNGAKMALETIERMISDGALFHALWWTPYVTFCALAVVYVWEIQQKINGAPRTERDPKLFALAEKCQAYLSQAISGESVSRRYGIIIEELRLEARQGTSRTTASLATGDGTHNQRDTQQDAEASISSMESFLGSQGAEDFQNMLNPLGQWQPTDWLDLDSSVFNYFNDIDTTCTLS